MTRFFLSLFIATIFLSCTNANKTKERAGQVAVCSGTKTTDKDWYASGKKAPLFKGLDGISFKISTPNKEAKEYFNQGMMLAYGFNHAEAARSFYEATRLDLNCAMAYWGYAYVLGPNYNGGMEEDNYQRAYDAAIKAQSLSGNCSPMEIALINALLTRYEARPPADRTHLDIAYAAAMKKVYAQYPTDPDVGALYAESMMNLHPWDLYEKQTKKPKAWTPELITVLERLIQSNPKHPGAHHFYIHALEASATPEKALESASLLSTLVPGSGHLLHMPSHIYINTGDYHLGTLSNLRAIAIDSVYTTACNAQGVYPLAYFPHNYHFLAATATLEGNSKLAWMAAKEIQKHTATDIMDQPKWGTLQHYYTIPYYIATKFAMWDSIFSFSTPPKDLIYPKAIWHYARGLAYLGKNDIINAQKESNVLRTLSVDTSLQRLTVWDINTTADLAKIADHVLSAGIAAKQNHLSESITLLNEAIAIEDNLNYNEPPDWFFSIRHHLGTVLIKAGKYNEAEKIYRQDLHKWKKNGWALIGLYNALMLQKKPGDAQSVKSDFNQSWKYADTKITSSSSIFN
uniref:tetratricopeptide repeat protein n=1 Tax=Pedobacter schmidteae TaxID=2201271 RepID=UPI000EB01852|nr:tetratricopeptide repeat protein [Pedobacter schmidteae]